MLGECVGKWQSLQCICSFFMRQHIKRSNHLLPSLDKYHPGMNSHSRRLIPNCRICFMKALHNHPYNRHETFSGKHPPTELLQTYGSMEWSSWIIDSKGGIEEYQAYKARSVCRSPAKIISIIVQHQQALRNSLFLICSPDFCHLFES